MAFKASSKCYVRFKWCTWIFMAACTLIIITMYLADKMDFNIVRNTLFTNRNLHTKDNNSSMSITTTSIPQNFTSKPTHKHHIVNARHHKLHRTNTLVHPWGHSKAPNAGWDNLHFNYSKHNGPCDYLNVKGIPKSGTTWLERGVLPMITNKVCTITNMTLEVCKPNHIGLWKKHQMTLPQDSRKAPWHRSPDKYRICAITTFRDPRDRIVSYAYFHYRTPDHKDWKIVNSHVRRDFPRAIRELKNWWEFYHVQGRAANRYLFYDYLYENLVINPRDVIMDLVEFIGFKDILITDGDESMIDEIAKEIGWDDLKDSKINTFRSGRNNGTNVCTYRKFISDKTSDFIDQQIIGIDLDRYLIIEWNKICPFAKEVLMHYNVSVLQ